MATQPKASPVVVEGVVNYVAPMAERPRYHANDTSRDVIDLIPTTVSIIDARALADPPRLDREGFALVPHVSAVADFADRAEVQRVHNDEIVALLRAVTGADEVIVSSPGILRFGEKSALSGALDNSRPARFVHIDVADNTARGMADRTAPRPYRRFASFNVWRALSSPPQDTPLTVCDARSVADRDLVVADAVFDAPDKPEWSFEGLVIAPNPAHRWVYWSNMLRDEALIFKTKDSDPAAPHHVPHSAFDDPTCPADAVPRSSIEMRAMAFWY